MKATVRKGFTLIEILIVVIILGILAAIVIPQFSSASEDAKASTASTMVQTVRSSIELYKLDYGDMPPVTSGNALWGALLVQGKHPTKGTNIGPYLQEAPANPLVLTGDAEKVAFGDYTAGAPTAAIANNGWVVCNQTGRVWVLNKAGSVHK